MESKYINRYHTYCKCLENLEKSKNADPNADFVLEGTIMNYNLTFDIAWKVMKDILVKQLEQIIYLFKEADVLEYIEICYGIFHCEGDKAVLADITEFLQRKGIEISA